MSSASSPRWGAVFSMSAGIFGLVGSEYLPASLLTPMADGLRITEGMAGQAVTVTAAVAVVASVLVSAVIGKINRRTVLTAFTLLLVLSNLLVAIAPDFTMLLLARVLLGVALGGFWSLSAATMMRLVPEADVPKALAILFGGVSAATVFAAPFGSYFGDLFGWRFVFLAGSGLGLVALLMQLLTLPPMYAQTTARLGTVFSIVVRPGIGLGIVAILLVFTGHFAFFTYLRPFLEEVTLVDPTGTTLILLVFGIGTFVGNLLSSIMIGRSLRGTLAAMPLIMGSLAVMLAVFGGTSTVDTLMIGLWGIAFGVVPVSWSAWVTRAIQDEPESGGGLYVATANTAIALGAAGGGLIFDAAGSEAVFLGAAVVLALSFALATMVKTKA